MAIYYVFQNQTYKEERSGGYVWSPKLNKAGHKNAGYTTMTNIKENDFILHSCSGKILSISRTKTDCFDALKPKELLIDWDTDGYQVNVEYFDFGVPLIVNNYRDWLQAHYIKDSAFTKAGRGKQQYMCHLAKEHAIYLLEQAIKFQKDITISEVLEEALNNLNHKIDGN